MQSVVEFVFMLGLETCKLIVKYLWSDTCIFSMLGLAPKTKNLSIFGFLVLKIKQRNVESKQFPRWD